MSVSNFRPLLLLAVALGMGACFSKSHESSEIEAPITKTGPDTVRLADSAMKNIKVSPVSQGEFPDELSVTGRVSVTEDRMTVVPARVAGRIDAVNVASGEHVGRDQLMASLFSPDYVVAREEYLQTLKQVQDSPADQEAKHLLGLARKKLESMGMSPSDIDGLGDPARAAALANLPVRATRSGFLLDKKAIVGNFVNQGDTLFTLGDISKVWFAGDVYPEDLTKVHKNQEVVIETGEGQPLVHGKVSFISPVVDPTTRTIKIRALMENPGGQLRADMYVKGNLILSKREAIIAPKTALVQLHDSVFTFKKVAQNTYQKTPVVVSGDQSGTVAVTQGLKAGDEVVSEGGLLLDAALTSNDTPTSPEKK